MQSNKFYPLVEWSLLAVYEVVVFIAVLLSLTVGRGLEKAELFDKATFYYVLIVAGLVFALALSIIEVFSKKTKGYGTPVIIHDLEDSPLALSKSFRPVLRYLKNPLFLIVISLILVSVYSVSGVLQNTAFGTGLPPVPEQQVSETAETIFALEPAVSGESLMFVLVFASLFQLAVRFAAKKLRFSPLTFWLIVVVVGVPLMGLFGVLYHSFRYAGQAQALFAVFLFWSLSALLTFVLQSIIPAMILHYGTNFFQKITASFASDTVAFSIIGGVLAFSIVMIALSVVLKPESISSFFRNGFGM